MLPRRKIFFTASRTDESQALFSHLTEQYGQSALEDADVIAAIGGDGFMIETLHHFHNNATPVYGINRGSVGFLMNVAQPDKFLERLDKAQLTIVYPLHVRAEDQQGNSHEHYAINEISLFRQSPQAAHVRILVDGVCRLSELVCDGVLVATPAGSTAYNFSVQGPIIPIGAKLLALTPISAFRPRRWHGALLPDTAEVIFEVLEPYKRPVSVAADSAQIKDVIRATVRQDTCKPFQLLFDPDHNLEDRILREQFVS